MQLGQSLFLISALFGAAAVPAASAQALADLQAQFGMNLKLTLNTPPQGAYVLKDTAYESSAKFVSITLTQKNWLASLIENGEIDGPLSGWSIVARTDSASFLALNYRLYAVKKGQPDHPLDTEGARCLNLEPGFSIAAFKERAFGGGFFTGSGIIRESLLGTFTTDGETLYLGGIATIPYTYKTFLLESARVSVPIAGSITNKVTGGTVLNIEDMGEFNVIVEGEITLKSHTVTALSPLASE